MLIEIHADVICPWSYIAKRRIEAALAEATDIKAVVLWRSFELAPGAIREPQESAAQMIRDWRGDGAATRIAEITALGAAEGLRLDLEHARPVSSFDAHRLLHLAAAAGKADTMMERLLLAYHSEGQNIADHGVLADLADNAELDKEAVAAMIAGYAHAEAVRDDESLAAQRGIKGVPVMVIAGGRPTSAVRPVAELVALLQATATRGRQATGLSASTG